MSSLKGYVDIKTAAKILNTSITNVYRMCKAGKFPNAKRSSWAIPIKDLKNPQILNRKRGRPWPTKLISE
jgi:helix-turn-helix protein